MLLNTFNSFYETISLSFFFSQAVHTPETMEVWRLIGLLCMMNQCQRKSKNLVSNRSMAFHLNRFCGFRKQLEKRGSVDLVTGRPFLCMGQVATFLPP